MAKGTLNTIKNKLFTDKEINDFIENYVGEKSNHDAESIELFKRLIRENRIENANLSKVISKLNERSGK